MALRHIVPSFTLEGVDRASEPVKVIAQRRPPVSLEFRTGADLTHVVEQILENKFSQVEAAVGAGKSTKLPVRLAMVTGKLVFCVLPNRLLAFDMFQYISKTGNVECKYIDSCQDELPVRGIVYMSAAALVARKLQKCDESVVNATLFLDEVHESDAYTHVVRTMAAEWPQFDRVVMASATIGLADHKKPELPGKLTRKSFPEVDDPAKWDPWDEGKPWSIGAMANALMFVDSKTVAAGLLEKYRGAGYAAYRLTAKMSVDEFHEAVSRLRDPNDVLVVLIADYSFRSGFTLDVDVIIDSGWVSYIGMEGGRPVVKRRSAYELERYQAAGRGGRVGKSVVYYEPAYVTKRAICDLEGVELDAAAIVTRFLGYSAKLTYRDSDYAEGLVPKDLCFFLRSSQPMKSLPDTALEMFSVNAGRLPVLPAEPAVLRKVQCDVERAATVEQLAGATEAVVTEVVEPEQFDVEEAFRTLTDIAGAAMSVKMEVGKYYYPTGLDTQLLSASATFPDGLASVLRAAEQSTFLTAVRGLSVRDRQYALHTVLKRYNMLTAELEAVVRIVRTIPVEFKMRVPLATIKAWAVRMLEVAGMHTAELVSLQKVAVGLAQGFSGLRVYGNMQNIVAQLQAMYMDDLTASIPETVDEGTYARFLDKEMVASVTQVVQPRVLRTGTFSGVGPDSSVSQRKSRHRKRESDSSGGSGSSKSSVGEVTRVDGPSWLGIKAIHATILSDDALRGGGRRVTVHAKCEPKNAWGRLLTSTVGFRDKIVVREVDDDYDS